MGICLRVCICVCGVCECVLDLGARMFDFQSYVLRQQANVCKSPVRLQNYAYIEDIERLRQLSSSDWVCQAMSLGMQAWQIAQGRRVYAQSREIGRVERGERISRIWAEVCYLFGHTPLDLRLVPSQETLFEAYGKADSVFFGISGAAFSLPTTTMKFLFGRGIGALDNGHVPYLTLERFMVSATRGLWSKATMIPDALLHWHCFADITEDRAGLLASRDISAAIMGIMKQRLDWDDAEMMREIRRYHEKLDVDWGEPEIEKRVRALELFSESSLYRVTGGRSIEQIDEAVKDIFGLF